MTSETSNFSDCNSGSRQNPSSSKSNNTKKNSKLFTDINSLTGPMSVSKEGECVRNDNSESNQKSKKNLEMCGVHSKNTIEKNPQTVTKISPTSLSLKNEYSDSDVNETKEEVKQISSELTSDISNSNFCSKAVTDSTNNLSSNEKTYTSKLKEQSYKTEDTSLANENFESDTKNESPHPEISNPSLPPNENISTDSRMSTLEDILETKSQSSLPDILSTLNKPLSDEKKQEPDDCNEILPDAVDHEKGISPKSKSILSQTSYLPTFLSSEALHNEMEMELKQLQSLNSLKTNQSIYKLAYDENVTDQSDSRSPSPMDPECHMPCSITNSEILIHEADSDSEAGSEDVELLPHRYESETFLHENKHLYINKLSLAVELLRTQESLPYDNEFKRVVGENQPNNIMPVVHTGGKINMGYREGSSSPEEFSIEKHFESKTAVKSINGNDVSSYKLKHSAKGSNDSAIFSDIDMDNFEEESCETAKEAVVQESEIQDNTEQIRAGYRRFGVQARHYFSPRALSLNPCFCCIIM